MAADLGGSQISALLESVPGIVNVLRSPVADAIVNMIRAGAGVEPFQLRDAEELVQYAVRRGLIGAAEGDQVLQDVRSPKRKSRAQASARPAERKSAGKKPARKAAPKAAKKAAAKSAKKAAKAKGGRSAKARPKPGRKKAARTPTKKAKRR